LTAASINGLTVNQWGLLWPGCGEVKQVSPVSFPFDPSPPGLPGNQFNSIASTTMAYYRIETFHDGHWTDDPSLLGMAL
jgi:hypothetical protein